MAKKPIQFTDLALENWKRVGEFSDAVQRGLRLVGNKSGTLSWVYRYRHPISRKSRKMTLPPGLTLAQARKLASDAAFLIATKKVDPVEHEREQKRKAVEATEGTLSAVAKRYLDIEASKLRSSAYYENTLIRLAHILEAPPPGS